MFGLTPKITITLTEQELNRLFMFFIAPPESQGEYTVEEVGIMTMLLLAAKRGSSVKRNSEGPIRVAVWR